MDQGLLGFFPFSRISVSSSGGNRVEGLPPSSRPSNRVGPGSLRPGYGGIESLTPPPAAGIPCADVSRFIPVADDGGPRPSRPRGGGKAPPAGTTAACCARRAERMVLFEQMDVFPRSIRYRVYPRLSRSQLATRKDCPMGSNPVTSSRLSFSLIRPKHRTVSCE